MKHSGSMPSPRRQGEREGRGPAAPAPAAKDGDEALHNRDALYRDLVEGSLQGIVIHRDRRFLFVNRAYAEAMGYASPEEVLALPSMDVVVDEADRERLRDYAERRLRGEEVPATYEAVSVRKDGSRVEFIVYSRAIRWHDEPAIQSTLIDLTEQKRALAALQASEARFRELAEGSLQGMVIHRNLKMHFANRAYAETMGYDSPQELLALPSMEVLMPPWERERLPVLAAQRIIGHGVPAGYVADALRKDGSIVTFRAYSRVVDWMGEPAIQTTAIDITEQKRAEEALRQKEWELSRAQQAANIGSWHMQLRDGTLRWSEQTFRIFGQDPDRFAPSFEGFLRLVHPDDRRLFHALPPPDPAEGGRRTTEYRILRPDGTVRTVKNIGEVLSSATGEPEAVIGTVQDITERKATEHRLMQAQKMEAVGRLSGGVAHDFNNLLTIIHGNLELALLQVQDQPCVQHLLQSVLEAAQRGAELTRLMLAYSRRQPLTLQVADVQRIVDSVGSLLRRTLGEGIELELVRPDQPLWPVLVDAGQLESALINLAVNARDAMPRGGRLAIEAGNVHLPDAPVETDGAAPDVPPGAYVAIAVRDSGAGIEPALLDKVFEPFFTTKEVGKGSGLGLSMVYGFIRQSGGQIRLQSTPAQGTAVTLFLPRHEAAAMPVTPAGPSEAIAPRAPVRGTGRVLVVEDEPEIRRLAVHIFSDLGFEVTAVSDASHALAQLADGERPDLLFTDMVLPGRMSGLELADHVRSQSPQLPVMIATGYVENLEALQSRRAQGFMLVEKPYSGSVITERLRGCGLLGNPADPVPAG
ncbi:MAG TPA: PAS domain S-box protein [bacterium]|nr:PAS domain S-box protein [bacterium]